MLRHNWRWSPVVRQGLPAGQDFEACCDICAGDNTMPFAILDELQTWFCLAAKVPPGKLIFTKLFIVNSAFPTNAMWVDMSLPERIFVLPRGEPCPHAGDAYRPVRSSLKSTSGSFHALKSQSETSVRLKLSRWLQSLKNCISGSCSV